MKKTFNTPPSDSYLKIQVGSGVGSGESLLAMNSLAMVQRYETVLTAEQISTLGSNPPVLNLPPGRYLFVSGAIFCPSTNIGSLDLGDGDVYIADEKDYTLTKQPTNGRIEPGGSLALLQHVSPTTFNEGSFRLATDADTSTPLTGEVKIILLVVPF